MNFASILPRFFIADRPSEAVRTARRPAPAPPMSQRALPRRATIRLQNTRLELCVLKGCVWITRDGDPKDLVLMAGEVFEQRPGAPVLVQALDDTELLIAPAGTRTQNP